MARPALSLLALTLTVPLAAQTPGLYYPEPPASSFRVTREISYGTSDTGSLRMDLYRPAGSRGRNPGLVFHTIGSHRGNPGYASWARIAASQGIVAVLADLRVDSVAQDFQTLLAHLSAHGATYGLDTASLVVFGASNNGFNVFPVAQNPEERRVKGVVMYYSGSDVRQLRQDLPVLYVRAGLDRPFVNASIDSVIARALTQNAPVTVINHASGHHSFETTDDDALTRDLVDQTLAFVKRVTAPGHREAITRGAGYARAAGYSAAGDFSNAAKAYSELLQHRPEDPRLRLSYGEALLGDGQFEKACDEFETLKGKGLGPRDLGLPAARACLQKGDPEAAMAWLASIPQRFLPGRVREEAVFAPLLSRPDFQALFRP